MCEITTALAVGSLAASAAGTAVAYTGQQRQAAAAEQAADYQSKVASNNARAAEIASEQQAADVHRSGAARLGMMRATLAANGVDLASGSALQAQQGLGETVGMDAARTAYNGGLQSMGFRQQALLDQSQARNAAAAGGLAAASTLIGGASQFSTRWSAFRRDGVL